MSKVLCSYYVQCKGNMVALCPGLCVHKCIMSRVGVTYKCPRPGQGKNTKCGRMSGALCSYYVQGIMFILCPGYYGHILSRILCSYYVQGTMFILCTGYYGHIMSRVLCSYSVQGIMFILCPGYYVHIISRVRETYKFSQDGMGQGNQDWGVELVPFSEPLSHLVNHKAIL